MQKQSEHIHTYTFTVEEVVKKLVEDTCHAEAYSKATMRCIGSGQLILELTHTKKEEK
jgi:hypothetical protein